MIYFEIVEDYDIEELLKEIEGMENFVKTYIEENDIERILEICDSLGE